MEQYGEISTTEKHERYFVVTITHDPPIRIEDRHGWGASAEIRAKQIETTTYSTWVKVGEPVTRVRSRHAGHTILKGGSLGAPQGISVYYSDPTGVDNKDARARLKAVAGDVIDALEKKNQEMNW